MILKEGIMRLRIFILMLLVLALMSGMASAAVEEKWPTKPIELIIGWPPGGPADNAARIYAPIMSKELGVPITIVNKPGATGALGAEYVARAKPDGYTIMESSFSVISTKPLTHQVNYTIDDFTYILSHTDYGWCLLVKQDAPWKDYKDFLQYARKASAVPYGTAGAYNSAHVIIEWIARREGVNFSFVPFKGIADMLPALMGGHIVFAGSSGGHAPLVQGGKLRTLLQFSGEVVDSTKVPYITEVYSDFPEGRRAAAEMPKGLSGPKGMPASVVNKLANALRKAVQSEAFQRYAKGENIRIVVWDGAKIYKAVQSDHEAFGSFLKSVNFKKP